MKCANLFIFYVLSGCLGGLAHAQSEYGFLQWKSDGGVYLVVQKQLTPETTVSLLSESRKGRLKFCQWFHHNDFKLLDGRNQEKILELPPRIEPYFDSDLNGDPPLWVYRVSPAKLKTVSKKCELSRFVALGAEGFEQKGKNLLVNKGGKSFRLQVQPGEEGHNFFIYSGDQLVDHLYSYYGAL